MNIVFLGPPGSGKGTQAKKLVGQVKLTHVSTGDVFREAIKGKSQFGEEIRAYVENGKLVPDHLVSAVVFEKLKKFGQSTPFLLDGYPRTVGQAKELDHLQEVEKIPIHATVNFAVKSEELIKRLSARRECGNCKEVFNRVSRPPAKDGVCDKCSNDLIQRADDKEEVVRQRLVVYETQTAPILEYYTGRNSFFTVDANQDIDQVFGNLTEGLKRLGLGLN